MFRNLTFFRFASDAIPDPLALRSALEGRKLREVGPMEQATYGFVSPYGRDKDEIAVVSEGHVLFCLGGWEKVLPATVVRDALAEKVAQIQKSQGRRVGARERRRLKDEVLADLLSRAFVRSTRTMAYLDPKGGWLVVDSASRRKAEQVVTEIRQALGRFPATPAMPGESPRALMTDWLVRTDTPQGWVLGNECLLRQPSDTSCTWTGRNTDLDSEEVRNHLSAGMQAERLGVIFRDRLTFVLGEDLMVRKLRYTDMVEEERSGMECGEADQVLEAEFALLRGELAGLLGSMTSVFGVVRPGMD